MPDIGLREILMIAVAATAAYLLLSLLRLLQIARRKTRAGPAAKVAPSEPGGEASAATIEVDAVDATEPPSGEAEVVPAPPQQTKAQRHWLPRWIRSNAQGEAAADGATARPGDAVEPFGDQLFRSTLEAELRHLRSDVAGLREELKLLKAARRVSPQYNEAMMLAQRGIDAQGIAQQCGISVGEAELVLALSRDNQEYEDYGEDDPRRSAG